MTTRIDMNCDLGEGFGIYKIGDDAAIMPHITSANIACGFHAGDPTTIDQTIKLARESGVAVGAHPSYPDLQGFGRRDMVLTPKELTNCILYQISAIHGFTIAGGTDLQHVKPHGALYNQAAKDETTSKAIVEAIRSLNSRLAVLAPPNSTLSSIASKAGLRVAHEFFSDRAYNPNGSLVSRRNPRAVIHDKAEMLKRTMRVITDGKVSTIDGQLIDVPEVHTICIHGDTSNAVMLASTLKKGLVKSGIKVQPLGEFL